MLVEKTLLQRSGWAPLVWGTIAAILQEAVLPFVASINVSDWARPYLPIVVGLLGLLLKHARSKSVPARDVREQTGEHVYTRREVKEIGALPPSS